jgi:RNA polymerase sigma factor (sigma-70 family)
MSTAPLAAALTSLRQDAAERSDRQLLDAYAAANDQSAFAALVRRHGPMVLGVCRRLLRDAHDAEDAFQATFLVLARGVHGIRKGDSLSSWLHGVCYRVAMRAKRDAARRRKHEGRAQTRTEVPAWETGWRELQTVLDEEIEQLPLVYRAVFVLCCLDGLSKAEAARRLGVNENTVSSRLARARKQLRERLGRRGISLSAVLAALAVSGRGRAAVPATLARSTMEAAARLGAGTPVTGPSARAFSLAEGVTRTMLPKKWKLATALLLALCALGTGLAVAASFQFAEEQRQVGNLPPQTPTKPIEGSAAYGGRVLDPDGKPVAGAKLYALYYTPKVLPIPQRGTSDKDGNFRFTVEKKEFDRSISARPWNETTVVAVADGYGLGIPVFEPGKRFSFTEQTLRLTRDDRPISGRIIDLEGKPVAGATVTVHSFFQPMKRDLTAWLAQLKERQEGYPAINEHLFGLGGLWMGRDVGRIFPPALTDAEGRFRIKGVGRERLVGLRIEGPTLVSTQLWAMTRPCDTLKAASWRRGQGDPAMTFVGTNFRHIVPPGRPIVGVVRDKDTGKPIPGAVVQSYIFGKSNSVETHLRTVADKDGRYRLPGMPKGEGNQIRVGPPDGQPYLMALASVPEILGLNPVTVDVKLKRGIWITGKVTDKVTGKPVPALIEYAVFQDNSFRQEAPGLTFEDRIDTRPEDGTFRFVGLPGHSVVGAQAWRGQYLRGVGFNRFKDLAFGGLGGFHTAVEINPAKDAETARCDLLLDPGRTLTVTVLAPDGKSLTGVQAYGLQGPGDWGHEPGKTAEFTVAAMRSDESRLLQFSHAEKKLAGSRVVRGDEKGPLTLKLSLAGVVTGRFVTPDGKALADLELFSIIAEPLADPRDPPKLDLTAGAFPSGLRTDKEGKFRIEGIVPGLKYRIALSKGMYTLRPEGAVGTGVTVKAGETKDLGEVKIKPFDE